MYAVDVWRFANTKFARACIYIYIVGPGGINVKIYRQILIGKSSCVSMGYGIK